LSGIPDSMDGVQTGAQVRLPELAEAVEQRAEWDARVTDAVIGARRQGASWDLIAQVLGVSRQSAWERYAPIAG
jgi:hypothetical protein